MCKENSRVFDLEQAKAGHPIETKTRKKALFIAHHPEAGEWERVVFQVEGVIYYCREDGSPKFLSPAPSIYLVRGTGG